jgi:hypothetical protein
VLTVVCVETGNYLCRGAEYVEKLAVMVGRHLTAPYRFECLRPDTGLEGWWNKVELFRPRRFCGRVLYLDLDTVIVGPIDELVEHKGCLHLDRWGWTEKVYGSGVMVWDAGEHAEVFERFTPEVPKRYRGDQDWMTSLGGWDALPDGICVSYRYHSIGGPPKGASVVCFHGIPKPHEFTSGWVAEAWR